MLNFIKILNLKYYFFLIEVRVIYKDIDIYFQFRVGNLVKDFGVKIIMKSFFIYIVF